MSSWTYVTGIIKVDVYSRTDAETMYFAQTVLNHLPRITGSEGNVKAHIHLEDGYSSSSNTDEFENFSNLGNEYFSSFKHQDKALITLSGYLRDREFEETFKETYKFLCRLAKRLSVYDCLVKVNGYDREHIFTNKNNWLSNMYPDYEEERWTDFLKWKPNRDTNGNLIGGKPKAKS